MAKNNNLFYIKGFEVKHSMHFGSTFVNKQVEVIGSISDYNLEIYDKKNNKESGVVVTPSINITNNEISLGNKFYYITEMREVNDAELQLFNTELAKYNIVFEKRKLAFVRHPIGKSQYVQYIELLHPYYISKDDMQIVFRDGRTTTYKELLKNGFGENDKVVLNGDNGYSHCWAETFDAKAVFNFIELLFETQSLEKTASRNRAVYDSRVPTYSLSLYGWNFNEQGQLIVNITKKDIHYSEVSNT